MNEHVAYVIADTEADALDIYHHWNLAGHEERRAYESWNIVFKGEADARYLLAQHLKEAKPGATPQIWKLDLTATALGVTPSETGIPPYADGDIITVYDREYGLRYRARVTEVLLTGATRPWMIHFESVQPIEPGESRHHVGSLEAHDNGTSPNIIGGTP